MPYEKGALNACLQNGVLCDHLRGYHDEESTIANNKVGLLRCYYHNECGRGMCKDYRAKRDDSLFGRYERAYNWYVADCARMDDKPVDFNTYHRLMREWEIDSLIRMYDL